MPSGAEDENCISMNINENQKNPLRSFMLSTQAFWHTCVTVCSSFTVEALVVMIQHVTHKVSMLESRWILLCSNANGNGGSLSNPEQGCLLQCRLVVSAQKVALLQSRCTNKVSHGLPASFFDVALFIVIVFGLTEDHKVISSLSIF